MFKTGHIRAQQDQGLCLYAKNDLYSVNQDQNPAAVCHIISNLQ